MPPQNQGNYLKNFLIGFDNDSPDSPKEEKKMSPTEMKEGNNN